MNKQGKNGIGWCQYSWNPLKGMCPVNCRLPDGMEYCYARNFYRRVLNKKYNLCPGGPIILDLKELLEPDKKKGQQRIFVCSTYELFHTSVDKWMRDNIFTVIKENSQHTFQILTKMPENIDREMPENAWLGVSITSNDDEWRTDMLAKARAKVRFISCEPMLSNCEDIVYSFDDIDWLILGRLTGHGRKYDPIKSDIEYLIKKANESNVPVFLKNNLKEIWGENLIQEFPQTGNK